MADDNILKQDIIAAHLKLLYKEVRALKRDKLLAERREEFEGAESPNNNDFRMESRFDFDVCKVTSLVDANTFMALRQEPTSSDAAGWAEDTDFSTKPLLVTKAPQISLPSVDDVIPVFFTGTYGDPPTARYGFFQPTSVAEGPLVRYELNSDQTLSIGSLDNLDLSAAFTELENTGVYTLDLDNIVMPAAAAGKMVVVKVSLSLDLTSMPAGNDPFIEGWVYEPVGAEAFYAGNMVTGQASTASTLRLSFSHEFRATLNDKIRVQLRATTPGSVGTIKVTDPSWVQVRAI